MSFNENLQRQMIKESISQTKLSEKVGISKVSLANYINGKCLPNLEIAARLSEQLNCSIDYLYFGHNSHYHKQESKDINGIIAILRILNMRGKTQLEESIENIASNMKNVNFQEIDKVAKYVSDVSLI